MTILKENKPYTIEYRIFKNTSYFRGWFKNMKPDWSEWTKIDSYNNIKDLEDNYNKLESKKSKMKYRVEYRMVKENKI